MSKQEGIEVRLIGCARESAGVTVSPDCLPAPIAFRLIGRAGVGAGATVSPEWLPAPIELCKKTGGAMGGAMPPIKNEFS